MAKKISNRKKDALGKRSEKDFVNLSFEIMRNYIKFEMEITIFRVGNRFLKQKEGLPMGGLISAGLASIDCMRKENENQKSWRHLNAKSKCIRYRDDIFVLVMKELSDSEVKNTHKKIEKVYGKNLEVELESVSNESAKMLDLEIFLRNDKLETLDNNKNSEYLRTKNKGLKKTRFPSLLAKWEPRMYKNVMIAHLNKIYKNVNTAQNQIASSLRVIEEWQELNYPVDWINSCVNKSRIRYKRNLRL